MPMKATIRGNGVADSDMASFQVYVGTESSIYLSAMTTSVAASANVALSVDLTNLNAFNTYYVAVTSKDSTGNESAKSTQVNKPPKFILSR
jgi:hypothetical protein